MSHEVSSIGVTADITPVLLLAPTILFFDTYSLPQSTSQQLSILANTIGWAYGTSKDPAGLHRTDLGYWSRFDEKAASVSPHILRADVGDYFQTPSKRGPTAKREKLLKQRRLSSSMTNLAQRVMFEDQYDPSFTIEGLRQFEYAFILQITERFLDTTRAVPYDRCYRVFSDIIDYYWRDRQMLRHLTVDVAPILLPVFEDYSSHTGPTPIKSPGVSSYEGFRRIIRRIDELSSRHRPTATDRRELDALQAERDRYETPTLERARAFYQTQREIDEQRLTSLNERLEHLREELGRPEHTG